jgi:hypothetical protein
MWQVANNWLVLAAFDALERSQDLELFVALLVLFNWLLTWIVVLLVTQQDMIQQGAFRRQESACHLQRFCVPILTLKLSITFNFWLKEVCPRLQKKPHLSRHAEVAYRKDRQILQEHITTKLKLIVSLTKQVPHSNRLDLHDVADVQIKDPFVLI